ncbi:cobalt ECF transporter T component CbiQ [Desertifilum sp. FACHB-1129]|uniref:Cobalt ECF transporter T component CbiQ n=1 Tax=Desertifilum tharense IPPAS B-1220 TaxID=1781255 RepID=A0A1E5QG82_9CYAN|nr:MULTISPECIES: cobalt ECF transporter T component CbiQ [Desertifilum]MDA0209286.1 cobalt ECF transporter T component CbiQ [Cyanobacteria bacterium FC1]MBD2315087.1 cobalt ECF transporter T component CbiQ [Desertifilum sp. FACHB-1129]MBD2325169.1 cobalt ECF transporter T component CbiQ [Desertifilum sp. FACHB-866]MBD2332689.1 cobalt ECF transporter T component CbiQ [Desertifilum sp. FACHB-868]OEJ73696.1 cobalt ECF transporter T component CbiQ [Desertifilum tharense IPPAS B-1220]
MHHHLDAYAYTNRLRPLPPQQKLIFALVVLGIASIAHPATQGLILIWLSVWIVGYARIPPKVYGSVLGVMLIFLLTSIPALVLEIVSANQRALVQANSVGGWVVGNWYCFISRSGLVQAAEVGMRSLACIPCLLLILFTIPFAELLGVLRQWRVPGVLVDLLLLMYRFIFLFLDVLTQLQLAQRSRGGYRTRQRWMYSAGLLASQLVVRSLQRYQQFSLGLATRGFNGDFQVYANPSSRYSRRYAIESLVGCVGLVILELRF